ncbi:MAG: pyruvate formate-lyase-activating protein [Erysipelotrichaceae bacterium]|nr:pyruvate formate-lyase-activating protein [Erysipelotrichaceae bacterium]
MKGAVDSIETFGLVDGPGIRTVVFLSGCKLRCKYCHNPEMWIRGRENYTPEELAERILRNKNYFQRKGGVTFSGGEPLLQSKFIIEVAKILKKENIHIALDTAGVGNGDYEEVLKYIDLVILDIKHTTKEGYQDLTGYSIDESLKFIDILNQSGKTVWIRQVVVPGIMDNEEYLDSLLLTVKKIKNIEKIEFLPYHKLGSEKYITLGIENPYLDIPEMDKEKCQDLYKKFMKKYQESRNL